jgi:DNA-binding transcriptional regulator YiaG
MIEKRSPRRKIEIGADYGHVTVVGFSQRKGGAKYYACHCEVCGRDFESTAARIYVYKERGVGCGECAKKAYYEQRRQETLERFLSQPRSATHVIGRKLNKNNTTGHTGVYYKPNVGIYVASIRIKDDILYLGQYDTYEAAVEARKKAEQGILPDVGVMNSPVYELIQKLGMSEDEFAEYVGVPAWKVKQWASGGIKAPEYVVDLITRLAKAEGRL